MIVRDIGIKGRCGFEIARDVLDSLLYDLVHADEYSLEFLQWKAVI